MKCASGSIVTNRTKTNDIVTGEHEINTEDSPKNFKKSFKASSLPHTRHTFDDDQGSNQVVTEEHDSLK